MRRKKIEGTEHSIRNRGIDKKKRREQILLEHDSEAVGRGSQERRADPVATEKAEKEGYIGGGGWSELNLAIEVNR